MERHTIYLENSNFSLEFSVLALKLNSIMFLKNENKFPRENPADYKRLSEPMLALENLSGYIIIDEIQRIKELFPVLRVIVDQENSNKKFLILGSASRELIKQSSESLAGRSAYIEVTPFNYIEIDDLEKLWLRGGFPRSYLAQTDEESGDWRDFYIKTFLEQDIPNLGISIPALSLRRFWMMLTHYHGNIFNASELGRSFGASDVTIMLFLVDIFRSRIGFISFKKQQKIWF